MTEPAKISEEKIRRNLRVRAMKLGATKELDKLFAKWDAFLAMVDGQERLDAAKEAILEVQHLLNINPADQGLIIGDELVVKPLSWSGKEKGR